MRTLYTGLNPPKNLKCLHCPLIKIIPRKKDSSIQAMLALLPKSTHLIFTSGQAARIFFSLLPSHDLVKDKIWIAVGKKTACRIPYKSHIPQTETAEGVCGLIIPSPRSFFIWPHSSLSRPVITEYLEKNRLNYFDCILYDTIPYKPHPLPSLENVDEIIFTSPSTIQGFIGAYGFIPQDKVLTPIGPITAEALHKWINKRQ